MKRILFLLLFITLITSSAFATDVKLTINNIEVDKGNIMIGVCTTEDEFLENKVAKYGFFFPAKKGSITETISIPDGKYAIIVYHDANSDKILNKGFMGKPTEKYGFSNNFFGSFGKKPPFEKAIVDINSSSNQITINLR